MAARQARDTETEDVSMALVTFDNGAMATVVNSVVSPRETSVLRFDFERATVEVEHLYGYSDDDWTITPARAREGGRALAARPRRRAEQPRRPVRRGPGRARPGRGAARHAGGGPADDGVRRRRLRLLLHRQARPQRELGPGSPFTERMDGTGAPWRTLRAKRASDDPHLQATTRSAGPSPSPPATSSSSPTPTGPTPPCWSRRSRTCTRSAPLAGDTVPLFRPHDHVWHKGIAWSLPHVGEHNFWGGPTYVHGASTCSSTTTAARSTAR